jgi:hypothetical protein
MEPFGTGTGPTGMGELQSAGTRATGVFAVAIASVTAGVLAAGCSGAGAGSGVRGGAADPAAGAVRLVAFNSCPELLGDLRAAAERSGAYGLEQPVWGGVDGLGGPGRGGPPVARGGAPQAESGAAGAPGAPGAPAPADGGQPGAASRAQGQGQNYSGTNVHEAGVDEPDLVKTDGRRIVTVADGRLRVIDAVGRRVSGTVDLSPDLPRTFAPNQVKLLLHGNRALVFYQSFAPSPPPVLPGPDGGAERGSVPSVAPGGSGTRSGPAAPPPTGPTDPAPPNYGARMALVDLTGAPRVVGRLDVEGVHVDARQVGAVARIVVRSRPHLRLPPPDSGTSPQDAERAGRQAVRQAPVEAWLPRYQVERDGARPQAGAVPCDRVSRPRTFTGSSMLTVLTVDLTRQIGNGDPVTVVADGETVYGTATSLYVTNNPDSVFARPLPAPGRPLAPGAPGGPGGPGTAGPDRQAVPPPPERTTEVHRFDISRAGRPHYAASGAVPGRLLNQYSLSEHQGRLRVATTTDPVGPVIPFDPSGGSRPGTPGAGAGRVRPEQSAVTVLVQRGGRLVTEGRVDGLGKGERIYAVRFLGPLGYVVTFRETDPLYVIDLRDPAKPRVTGELKVTGYSAYLHPAGEGLLIGVGQEATEQGRRLGTQVALYDVRDPARPRRLAAHHVPAGSSEVEFDPHAFLHWPRTGLTVVPLQTLGEGRPTSQALVLKVGTAGVRRLGEVGHPAPERPGGTIAPYDAQIRRSLVIGSTLWTVSTAGLEATDPERMAKLAWVALD